MLRIFAGGVSTETNTFSPAVTGLEDFQVQPDGGLPEAWHTCAAARGDEFIGGLMAWAPPSGVTLKATYESLRDELLADLRAALPVDVVLLMLHGAMVAQGYEDCEEDIIRRVRAICGAACVVGVELDLHCHLTPSKIEAADIVLTYKEYPHVDVNDRARQLFDLAVAARQGEIHPRMALFDCHMIGLYPTSREPLRGFVDSLIQAERRPGVLAVSFGHGFHFADLPHAGAKVLSVVDGSVALAREVAEEFGLQAYTLRRELGCEAFSFGLDEALIRALQSTRHPVVVADQSDNTGGGAPGDSTYALRWLLDRRVTGVALAILHDPEVVKLTRKAGAGARLPIRLGGKTGVFSGSPIDVDAEVLGYRSNYIHALPQSSGADIFYPVGDAVGLRVQGIDIVVGSTRCQCFSPAIFTDFGIDISITRLFVTKSAQHFHAAFSSIASEIIYMRAPGAVVPDPRQIPYRRLNTGAMYPWVEDPLGLE